MLFRSNMKLYILVEDGKSGHKIIDHWIPLLLPTLTRAKSIAEIQNNQYVLYSGMGYPRLLGTDRSSPEKNILGQTIDTINLYQTIDYLLIFLDGDDDGVSLRHQIVQQKIESYHRPLSCPYVIFVQNKCLETWLLGNRDLFPTTPLPNFLPFLAHYNVSIDDPEQMEKDPNFAFASTSALYHERYLRAMMQNLGYRYSKFIVRRKPGDCIRNIPHGIRSRSAYQRRSLLPLKNPESLSVSSGRKFQVHPDIKFCAKQGKRANLK